MGNHTRRVQWVSGTTFSLTLPKPWALRVGLKAGDEVGCLPQPDGSLLLRPQGSDGPHVPVSRRLGVRGLRGDQLQRRIVGLYLAGVDAIVVQGDGPFPDEIRAALERIPRLISGLEIVEQGHDHAVFQDILDPHVDLDKAFLRVYGLASSMHHEVLAALTEGDPSKLEQVPARELDLDRLSWVAKRQLRVQMGRSHAHGPTSMSPADALSFASGLALVQRFGHCALNLADAAARLITRPGDARLVPGLVEVGTRALQVCDIGARAFCKADLTAADEALSRRDGFEDRRTELRAFAAARCLEDGICAPCLGVVQTLEWLHASVGIGARLAELAIERAMARSEDAHGLSSNGDS